MLDTSIVGSLPKPSWLALPGLRAPWRLSGDELRAAQDEAVRQAIHDQEEAGLDVVTDGDRMIELAAKRVDTKNTHGTGCTLSAAIAALLPVSPDAPAAIRRAKDYLVAAIAASGALDVGQGHGPVHHFHALWRSARGSD